MNIPKSQREKDRLIVAAHMAAIIELADSLGFIITIETSPLKPLAMGHYQYIPSIRDARKTYSRQPPKGVQD